MSWRRLLVAAVAAGATACAGGDAAPEAVPVEELAVDAGDVSLRARTVGPADAADVVITVHGGPGLSLEAMEPYEELAGEDRRVVAYDQRRSGPLELEQHVADLEAVRRATGAHEVAVVGQSWGGAVAAAYAASHPERVEALVLVGAVPLALPAFLAGQQRFRARVDELQAEGAIPDPLPTSDGGSCVESFEAALPAYLAEPAADVDVALASCDARASRATYDAFVDSADVERLGAALADFDGRALVVMGEDDPFGLAWLERSAALLSGADVETLVVGDAGHLVMAEQRDRLLAAVDRYLEG